MFRQKSFDQGGDFPWSEFINLKDGDFADITSGIICGLDPNGVIQVVVAYKNLVPIMGAGKDVAAKVKSEEFADLSEARRGELEKLGTLEGLIEMIGRDYNSFGGLFGKLRSVSRWGIKNAKIGNEATKRRLLWFLYAAFLMRAEKIVQTTEQDRDKIADAWIHIIQNATFFRTVLEHNILWSDEEKVWFELGGDPFGMVPDEKKSREFCARTMPRWLTKNAKMRDYLNGSDMKDWLRTNDLLYSVHK